MWGGMYRFFTGATAASSVVGATGSDDTDEGTSLVTCSSSLGGSSVIVVIFGSGVGAGFGWMTFNFGAGFFLGFFALSVAFTDASPFSFTSMPCAFRRSILKSIISPRYFSIVLLSQIQISLATCEINLMSWDTRTSPPEYLFTAIANASIDSISKWFVGSSNRRICGTSLPSLASTTRLFCPSESSLIFRACILPLTPNLPRYLC
mmetsp:Transcript_29773/g.54038  ORF Transcript_29773/g.54038 Transcript_29773/m.54038 type:complete len:206 (+) Transcript_29773:223-840(+)